MILFKYWQYTLISQYHSFVHHHQICIHELSSTSYLSISRAGVGQKWRLQIQTSVFQNSHLPYRFGAIDLNVCFPKFSFTLQIRSYRFKRVFSKILISVQIRSCRFRRMVSKILSYLIDSGAIDSPYRFEVNWFTTQIQNGLQIRCNQPVNHIDSNLYPRPSPFLMTTEFNGQNPWLGRRSS